MQNTVLGAPGIIVLHFEWNLLVESFWRVFFSSHYGSIMCNIHCATDETGSCTGQNGGCPGGLRPVRGQEVIPPRSLAAPKEAVTSSSIWHTQGEWLWPLGLGPERNKARLVHCGVSPHATHGLKIWPTEAMTLHPLFPWVLMYHLSAVEERKMKWWKRSWQRARLGAVCRAGELTPSGRGPCAAGQSLWKETSNRFVTLDYYRDQASGLQA